MCPTPSPSASTTSTTDDTLRHATLGRKHATHIRVHWSRQGRVHGGGIRGDDSRPAPASSAGPAALAEDVRARLPSGILSGFGGMLPAPGFSFSPPLSPSDTGALSEPLDQQLFPLSAQSPQPSFQWTLPSGGLNPHSPADSGGQQQAGNALPRMANGYLPPPQQQQQLQQQHAYPSHLQTDGGDGSVHSTSARGAQQAKGGDWSGHGVSLAKRAGPEPADTALTLHPLLPRCFRLPLYGWLLR